jgi:DNA processing protein
MAHDPADSRTLALVTLLRHHGNGVRTRQWLEAAGDPITALERAPRKPTDEGALGLPAMATAVDSDLAWLAQPGRHLLSITDPDFPPLLRDSGHAPAALWIEGDPLHLWQPQIAIVGARNATPSGIAIARDFSRTLANAGFCITSGLADGIDAAAHIAALDAGAATVAVCGTGLSMVYPRRHVALAQRLIRNGAQVSEFAPDTGVRAAHFPRRNRIIAGLSLGTLVVEAGLRSGSLVTARLATEQGREVFAIPGSIHNPLARGCHRLIRDGATLVEDAGEVIAALVTLAERLGHRIRARLAETSTGCTDAFASRADPDQSRVLEVLTGGPADVDALVTILGLAAGRVSAALVLLQVEGMVAQSSGGHWMRVGPVTGQTSNGSVCGGSA